MSETLVGGPEVYEIIEKLFLPGKPPEKILKIVVTCEINKVVVVEVQYLANRYHLDKLVMILEEKKFHLTRPKKD